MCQNLLWHNDISSAAAIAGKLASKPQAQKCGKETNKHTKYKKKDIESSCKVKNMELESVARCIASRRL